MGEVFDRYTDTVGNYHFTDTETGHHVISNESAIKELKWMLTDNSNTGDMYDALKMAIEALESLPNTNNTLECVELNNNSTKVDNENVDFIRRQDAIDCVNHMRFGMEKMAFDIITTALLDLPSAQPDCTDCIWDVCNYNKAISAQPEVSEWTEKEVIHKEEADKVLEAWQSAKCSKCGCYHTTPYLYYFTDYEYCPNCGALMKQE